MQIDISSLAKADGRVPVCEAVVFDAFDFCGARYTFSEINVRGAIVRFGGVITLEAVLSGRYTTVCARCLKPVSVRFEWPLNEPLTGEAAEEGVLDDEYKCRLEVLLQHAVLSQLPMTVLCREDCKGLCQMCGKNLNEGICDCKTDDWDVRFDVLKTFQADE